MQKERKYSSSSFVDSAERLSDAALLSPANWAKYGVKLQRRRSSAGEPMVPDGHVPVYVGDEMKQFVVSAVLLNHLVFVELLNKWAQEYG
ncbi:hypothetical protein ACFX1Q_003220 [Malus domestica]